MGTLANIVRNMADAVNIFDTDAKREQEVREAFASQHRSLQQLIVKLLVMPILRQLADSYAQGYYDLRNEASCKLASKMLAAVGDDDTYLPLV